MTAITPPPRSRCASSTIFESFQAKNCTFTGGSFGLYLSEGYTDNIRIDSLVLENVNFTNNAHIGFYCGQAGGKRAPSPAAR